MELVLILIMKRDSWLGVELRHLAALQALAAEGSFGRAAERLVERPGGPRPISLTEAGELLLVHADSIVARLQAAQADLHALRAGEAGELHVGTFQSVGARVLPEIIRRFREAWPAVELMLAEMDGAEIESALERGELDVGFV